MAAIMSKRGNLDNIVTFEHICDTVADMRNIDAAYATIGSVCLVLSGTSNMLEIYMADSSHQWKLISIGGGNGSEGSGSGSTIANVKICGDGEYDAQTYTPTISTPEQGIYYLVPNNSGYSQWEWINGEWQETFNTSSGGHNPITTDTTLTLSGTAADAKTVGDAIAPLADMYENIHTYDWGDDSYLDYYLSTTITSDGEYVDSETSTIIFTDYETESEKIAIWCSSDLEFTIHQSDFGELGRSYIGHGDWMSTDYEPYEFSVGIDKSYDIEIRYKDGHAFSESDNIDDLVRIGYLVYTDTTLTEYGIPADAAVVGNKFASLSDFPSVQLDTLMLKGLVRESLINYNYDVDIENTPVGQFYNVSRHGMVIKLSYFGTGSSYSQYQLKLNGQLDAREAFFGIGKSFNEPLSNLIIGHKYRFCIKLIDGRISGGGNGTGFYASIATNTTTGVRSELPSRTDSYHDFMYDGSEIYLCLTLETHSGERLSLYNATFLVTLDDLDYDKVFVTGTSPTITAEEGKRYVCDEVYSVDFTPCSSGLCELRFTSGSTPTVLTLPSTVKMPESFTVEPGYVYEINIEDGAYGVVSQWPI